MKKLAILFVTLFAMFSTSATPSYANKIFSHSYGQWELMAWRGNNQFCALKTYFGAKTISLRYDSRNGLTIVVYDGNFLPNLSYTNVNVYFNGRYYGVAEGRTYANSPNQVFVHVGFDRDFFERFQASQSMSLYSENLEYDIGLRGTRHLGNYLQDCVNKYGF